MLCMINSETDPAFNIAAEAYLLKNSHEDCFLLWRNRNAVIVGRNQNTLSQINSAFVERHAIQVVRRISGGGSVYHDLGNVNYTFIRTTSRKHNIDFLSYTRPILSFLNRINVAAILDGRNNLTVNGLKISGNAQHIHQQRVLHHGTLLFDTNLALLSGALHPNSPNYQDRAVASIRSRVTNISAHMTAPLSVTGFMEQLMANVQRIYAGRQVELSQTDRSAIGDLAEKKYRRWEWNYGNSPDYHFCKSIRTSAGTLSVRLDVKKGIIQSMQLFGDGCGTRDIKDVAAHFTGCRHSRDAVKNRIAPIVLGEVLKHVSVEQVLAAMF